MAALHQTKCINHESREAVARCPGCREFYCRECITEHDGRVICSSCLAENALAETQKKERAGVSTAIAGLLAVCGTFSGLLILWMLFYAIGQFLLLFPDDFHSGDMWKDL